MNNVILLGRLTRDPELRETTSGKKYCRFSIAVKRDFVKDGVDFINCVAWDKRAETIANYFVKGNRILINGRLNVGSYESNGETRTAVDVVVNSLDFIEAANSSKTTTNYNTAPISDFEEDSVEEDDDEFPF